MIAFSYYGGKNGMLKHLLPLLPATPHYCEPFAGSATVLLNRAPSPIETLNDLNGEIVNFFQVLRQQPDRLIEQLDLTPYAREEFMQAWEPTDCPVERARRFYITIQMDVEKAGNVKNKSWAANVKYCHGAHSYAVHNFHSKIPGLQEIAMRLKNTQIDNRSALDCIAKYDTPDTLFYCDPPYVASTRKSANDYKFEMDESAHTQLAQALNAVQGKVALSGYDTPLYADLYTGWTKVLFPSRRVPMSQGNGLVRQECLWINYQLPAVQAHLF